MVIKLLQQSTFRRYAAIVLSPFFAVFDVSYYAVNWCDKLRFFAFIGYIGDGFYRSKDLTNSIKVLKEKITVKAHQRANNILRCVVTISALWFERFLCMFARL